MRWKVPLSSIRARRKKSIHYTCNLEIVEQSMYSYFLCSIPFSISFHSSPLIASYAESFNSNQTTSFVYMKINFSVVNNQ